MPSLVFSEKSLTPGIATGAEFQGDTVTPNTPQGSQL